MHLLCKLGNILLIVVHVDRPTDTGKLHLCNGQRSGGFSQFLCHTGTFKGKQKASEPVSNVVSEASERHHAGMGMTVGQGREQQAIGTIELQEGCIALGKCTVRSYIRDGGPSKAKAPSVITCCLLFSVRMVAWRKPLRWFIVHWFFQSTNCCFSHVDQALVADFKLGGTGRLRTAKFMDLLPCLISMVDQPCTHLLNLAGQTAIGSIEMIPP